MFTRAQTRTLRIGSLPLGGGAPVLVQTMATADPHDAAALSAQIARCAACGADLVRLTVPDLDAARVLKALVTPKESGSTAKQLGGPVMIAEGLYRQVRSDGWDALGFLRFLNVNLAVLNLLPIPVLDGGLILFSLIALIFRRPVPRKIVDGLSIMFMYLFLTLMITLVWRDVARSRRMHKAKDELEMQLRQDVKRLKRAKQFKPAFDLGTLPEPAGRAGTPCPPQEK